MIGSNESLLMNDNTVALETLIHKSILEDSLKFRWIKIKEVRQLLENIDYYMSIGWINESSTIDIGMFDVINYFLIDKRTKEWRSDGLNWKKKNSKGKEVLAEYQTKLYDKKTHIGRIIYFNHEVDDTNKMFIMKKRCYDLINSKYYFIQYLEDGVKKKSSEETRQKLSMLNSKHRKPAAFSSDSKCKKRPKFCLMKPNKSCKIVRITPYEIQYSDYSPERPKEILIILNKDINCTLLEPIIFLGTSNMSIKGVFLTNSVVTFSSKLL